MALESSKLELVQQLDSAVSKTETQGTLRPITSSDTGRYERTGLAEPYNIQISSGFFTHSRLPEPSYLPENWSAHIHPEGQLYFHRDGPLRVVTEAYLYREETLELATHWIKKIEDAAAERNFPISDQVELFIKLEEENCAYYFVDHATRAQSWMGDIDPEDLGFPPVVSVSQLNILCEEQYWTHVEHFPMHIGLPPRIVDQLNCVLTHAICDQMTSRVSTFPYSRQECEGFVSLLRNLRDHSLSDGNIVCTIARLWGVVTRNRYLTHYGQASASNPDPPPSDTTSVHHLPALQPSVHNTVRQGTWLIRLLSPLLFFAPDFHLRGLSRIYTDGLIQDHGWSEFITRLTGEWNEFTLYATVMLHANVGFLSIQSVDQNGILRARRSPQQIFSYLSMLMSIGAIIIGLLLVKQNRDCATAPDAALYIFNRTHKTLGLETLAVLYSLPYSMLIWSIVLFLGAFSFMSFEDADLITRTVMGVLSGVVAVLILWCIFNGWERDDLEWGIQWLLRLFPFGNSDDAEDDGENSVAADDAKFTGSKTQPQKRRWGWLITSRKGSEVSGRRAV